MKQVKRGRFLRSQHISIQDIALRAGVSHSTVSRALHNSPLISAEVRERIQTLAREMGYVPNAIARSLQNQRTNTIGLVTTSISDPFFGDVVKGVEEIAGAANLSVVLSISHNDPTQEMGIIETFQQRRVDGIIIASSRMATGDMKRLKDIRIPTVLINSQSDIFHDWLRRIEVDDQRGVQLAVEHLLALGHRAIGYLGSEGRPRSNRLRLRAYKESITQAGILPKDDWMIGPPDHEVAQEDDVVLGKTLLPRMLATEVTAIICYNDMVAVGALLACREHGIHIPEALSIIGFDDIAMADYMMPPLTTVHQPKVELGRIATQMLLDLLHSRPVENQLLLPTLKVRSSTAAYSLDRVPGLD